MNSYEIAERRAMLGLRLQRKIEQLNLKVNRLTVQHRKHSYNQPIAQRLEKAQEALKEAREQLAKL